MKTCEQTIQLTISDLVSGKFISKRAAPKAESLWCLPSNINTLGKLERQINIPVMIHEHSQ